MLLLSSTKLHLIRKKYQNKSHKPCKITIQINLDHIGGSLFRWAVSINFYCLSRNQRLLVWGNRMTKHSVYNTSPPKFSFFSSQTLSFLSLWMLSRGFDHGNASFLILDRVDIYRMIESWRKYLWKEAKRKRILGCYLGHQEWHWELCRVKTTKTLTGCSSVLLSKK